MSCLQSQFFFCSAGTWPTQPTDRTTALPYKTNGAHELYGTLLMVIVYGQFKGLRHSGANAVPGGVWNHFREWYGRVVSVFLQITIQLFREWWMPLFTNICQDDVWWSSGSRIWGHLVVSQSNVWIYHRGKLLHILTHFHEAGLHVLGVEAELKYCLLGAH